MLKKGKMGQRTIGIIKMQKLSIDNISAQKITDIFIVKPMHMEKKLKEMTFNNSLI
jgi:hypothetical protein